MEEEGESGGYGADNGEGFHHRYVEFGSWRGWEGALLCAEWVLGIVALNDVENVEERHRLLYIELLVRELVELTSMASDSFLRQYSCKQDRQCPVRLLSDLMML